MSRSKIEGKSKQIEKKSIDVGWQVLPKIQIFTPFCFDNRVVIPSGSSFVFDLEEKSVDNQTKPPRQPSDGCG
jgi:hypothetical protein